MSDPRTPMDPNAPDGGDPAATPVPDPAPIPGAGGPAGGPNGDVLDGLGQPISMPGDRPPLSTDHN